MGGVPQGGGAVEEDWGADEGEAGRGGGAGCSHETKHDSGL